MKLNPIALLLFAVSGATAAQTLDSRDSFAIAFEAKSVTQTSAVLSGESKSHPEFGEPEFAWVEVNVGSNTIIPLGTRSGSGKVESEIKFLGCGALFTYQVVYSSPRRGLKVNSQPKTFKTQPCTE